MNEGRDLWQKYCAFFDKSFSEQVKYSEKKKEEYFEKWKNTKMAKQLCPKGARVFEDIPLTTYDDYPILHEFGKKIEKLEKTVPRNEGELWWDYYDRIGRQVAPILDGWMVDRYGFCAKTTGTTGKSKWFAHGAMFLNNAITDSLSLVILGTSDDWGITKLKPGDTYLNILAPAPYIAHVLAIGMTRGGIRLVPPVELTDNISDMRKKVGICIKLVRRGERIDMMGGIAPSLKMVCESLIRPVEMYRDYYQSMNFGMAKFVLFLIYLRYKISRRKYKSVRDLLPVKCVACAGVNAKVYFEYLREQFRTDPVNGYGSTEMGYPFGVPPTKHEYLFPILRSHYFEWLSDDGKIVKTNQLEKNRVYELIGSSFGSIMVRYRTGDMLRVTDYRDDGLPYFDFECRKVTLLDFSGYFRISESLIARALIEAGLKATDKWCVHKVMGPKEYLGILMEREWNYSEQEAEKRIYEALYRISPDFQNYVKDFRATKPSEIIRVEYLKKGAFLRYIMKKVKEGVPLGQIKSPTIIAPDKREIPDTLRSI